METFLIKAAQLILAFVLLVTIHEFGHYLFARIYGMRVERFYLFFNPWFSLLKYRPDANTLQVIAWTKKVKKKMPGPDMETVEKEVEEERSLLKFKLGKKHPAMKNGKPTWRATLYGLGWLPLGGYCSIAGMIDETQTADSMASEPEPWEFRAKKPFPRLMVMVAGVLFNFILAIVIYIGIAWYWGADFVKFDKAEEGMDYSEQFQKLGFRNGDILLTYNGAYADAGDQSFAWNLINKGGTVQVLRNHKDTVTINIPQEYVSTLLKDADEKAIFTYRVPVRVDSLLKGEPAIKGGILKGDRILRVVNDTTPSLTEFYPALEKAKSKTVPMLVERADGSHATVNVAVNSAGKIGIMLMPVSEMFPVTHVSYNFFESIPKGMSDGWEKLTTYVSSMKYIFTKEGAQSVGGFGAIGNMFPAQWNWYTFWYFTAFLSVILAFMNILPIPALDGGHVVFTLWEIITRRKPSIKVLEYSQMVGMAFLLLLLVYANGNDIYKFFFK